MTRPLLEVECLTVSFAVGLERITAVREISFSIAAGEIVGLVGESGSGKSLTALAVAGLLPAGAAREARSLTFDGCDLLHPTPSTRRLLGTKMALVFQDPMNSLNPAVRIGVQVTEGARVHNRLARMEAFEQGVARLADVGISAPRRVMKQFSRELSGGMRQRVTIAMGLMTEPDLIIADEPTTALDVTIQAQILELFREINEERGVAMLLISHDLAVISTVCDRVMVMYAGRIVEDASVETLLRTPAHPYTRALLGSVPTFETDRGSPLRAIPGRPPDPAANIEGCPFAGRCEHAIPVCLEERPRLEVVHAGHTAACWRANEELA